LDEPIRLPLSTGIGEVYLRNTHLTGTIAPNMVSLSDGVLCTSVWASELAQAPFPDPSEPGRSMLDVFVAPGFNSGMMVDGAQPDLDLDGDGLERFVVDTVNGRVVTCFDGDGTQIDGEACTADARIADGFAFTLRFSAASGFLLPPE